MNLDFDFDKVSTIEFGIGFEIDGRHDFVCVPVDANVQAELLDMAKESWELMNKVEEEPRPYEPSEKHAYTEYLFLPTTSEFAASLVGLHNANQLPINTEALDDPGRVSSYFCRLNDNSNRTLTALRRASQFKGMLKCRNRLIRMVDDTMKLIPDTIFKLDSDFDLLIDSAYVHILHPISFEFTCSLQQFIQGAAPQNIAEIARDLPFVDFGSIGDYAQKHTRAARYLASINSQGEARNIDKTLLVNLCNQTNVEIDEQDGKIIVRSGQELGFLEVLDRRRYEINLVNQMPEHYRAASRRKIDG
jgi:hypothetical protein